MNTEIQTQTNLVKGTHLKKKPDFIWKTKDDRRYKVKDMETRHLFNTIRMIWNHKMPADAALGSFIRYEFGSFYTNEYLELAIKKMLPELILRNDNKPYIKDINAMWNYLQKHRRDLLR